MTSFDSLPSYRWTLVDWQNESCTGSELTP